MKSITVHGMEDALAKRLQLQAQAQGQSLNKTIKQLLAKSLGMRYKKKSFPKHDFSEFCGVWSEKDYKEFEKNTALFEKIDKEDWK